MNYEQLNDFKKMLKREANEDMLDLIMNEDSLLMDIDWMRIGFRENLGRYGKIWWEWMQQNHPEQLIFSLKNDYYLVLHHEINLRAEVEYRELFTRYMIEQKTGVSTLTVQDAMLVVAAGTGKYAEIMSRM